MGGVSKQIWPSCCPSFSVCLSCGCIFSCFYQTPLSCLVSVFVGLSLSLSMFVSVCLSVSLCVFSSPSLPAPPLLLLSPSFFLSLSLTLAVSTFGETPQEHHPVKFFLCPPPPPLCPLFSTTGSNWLLALSFFVLLVVRTHSRRDVLCLILHMPQKTIQTPQRFC